MEEPLTRRLTTILAADVAGYSRLMAGDEEATIRRFNAARARFDALIVEHGGRIFNTAGDAVLAEFGSAVNAVRCAVAVQAALAAQQADLSEQSRIQFRMGIHVGDVIPRGADLLGDGVNVAARLQQMAPPGGIVVARTVAEQIEGKIAAGLVDLGDQHVKNIPRPIRAYRVTAGTVAPPRPPRRRLWIGLGAAAAAALTVAMFLREPIESWLWPPSPLPAAAIQDCPGCPPLMLIPAGRFEMGASAGETLPDLAAELPRRRVTIARPFLIGRGEVTRAQFQMFLSETGHAATRECHDYDFSKPDWAINPGVSWADPGFPQGRNHPVLCVSWLDARAYAAWLTRKTGKAYRLPSEAEWEYAARAETTDPRPEGAGEAEACRYGNVADRKLEARLQVRDWKYHGCDDGFAYSAPAGRFPANRFGLVDTIGNAWEWVEDCYVRGYEGAPTDQRPRTDGDCTYRVKRGGSWISQPQQTRFSARGFNRPQAGFTATGFRVVREP